MEHHAASQSSADRALQQLAAALLESGYSFVTPTPATHARVNARPGNALAADLAGIFGWSRPFLRETLSPRLFALAQDAGALLPAGEAWRSRFRLSTLCGMGLLHSAFPTDERDAVFLGPDTYRFANALSAHLQHAPAPATAVDIGCGTGAGALLIAQRHRLADIVMADINPEALRLARINAAVAGIVPVQAVQSDLLASVAGQFDLIVANPPYLPDPLARTYRDGGGALGAGLSLRIVREATERLAPGGTLLLYTGTAIVAGENPFLAAAAPVLEAAGLHWRATELDPDVFGEELEAGAASIADRIAVLCLTATRDR